MNTHLATIVLVITGAILFGSSLFLYRSDSVVGEYTPTIEEELDSLISVVTLFDQIHGRYPESLEELVMEGLLDRSPVDFWRRRYGYATSPPSGITEVRDFYVWTLGRDGALGGKGPDADHIAWPDGDPSLGLR